MKQIQIEKEQLEENVSSLQNINKEYKKKLDVYKEYEDKVKYQNETIQKLNTDVHNGSLEMYQSSQKILKKTEDLVHITAEIDSTMTSMSANTQEIESSVETVVSLGKMTESGVKTVKSEIDRFIL